MAEQGNMAAMREALMDIVLLTVKAGKSLPSDVACGIIASKAKHALAAPARNCDRYDVEDGSAECMQAIDAAWNEIDTIRATIGWMLAKAEGGAE